MLTDSTARRLRLRRERELFSARRRSNLFACLTATALAFLAIACGKPPTIIVDELLEPLTTPQPWLPGNADLAAARLARAALIARAPLGPEMNPEKIDLDAAPTPRLAVEKVLAELRDLEISHGQKDLTALAIDLRNATLDDPIAYRTASRRLRRRSGLDPRLGGRLDRTIGDDPLKLAGRRQFDGWHRLWARSFNAVSQPLGNSVITGFVIAPFQLANSLIHYFAEFSNHEPLSFTDRQALSLRQEFLARHPTTSATPELEKKVERDVLLLEKTLALRRVRSAESAVGAAAPALAHHHAIAAIEILSSHPDQNSRTRKQAVRLVESTEASLKERARLGSRSLEAIATRPEFREAELTLATTLLANTIDRESFISHLDAYRDTAGPEALGRTEFIRALSQHENGFEAAARKRLLRVSGRSAERDAMARHAHALLENDWQNPHGAFERLERKGSRNRLAWRLAGEWVKRPRYPNLPTPVAYLIDTPTIVMTIILAPLRAIISPWTGVPDFQRATALAGYRYLIRFPEGEQQRPVIRWLYEYERDEERWGRALRMADWIREFDPEERAELVEKTAEERSARVERLDRRDLRGSILRGIAQEFPDSAGGQLAGLQARKEREEASPQSIRITKEFLLENPSVAGRGGLGLNSKLLNDDPTDGELHPEGIVLRGGRVLELRLIAEGGDDEDPPEPRVRKISKKRLARTAAALAEAVQLNSLIDVDARQAADANRDTYLERAGLQLTEDVDARPAAQSSFVYRSLRERYGMVRGRDSILPFDLVFRGSLGDFTLGAFPRWRLPRETQDAFLYR
ncbi:MAG: hypothetical protein GY910_08470 [bacterium]|nr:hypothetical protein [bacterium]